jgi:di/tricarboxylate transporter
MTTEMLIVTGVIIVAIILFVTEKIPVDLTAVIVMGILLLSGIISPSEGLSGFSNTATVTVAAMFIVSAALTKTGAVEYLGVLSSKIFKYNFWFGLIITMIFVGAVSAFINNTPVIAVFIPILLSIAADNKISPAKLLMPVSFASMFGGVCTLIGTSTNILVSSIAEQHNQPAFSMFEFTSLGITFFAAGMIYMIFFGVNLIPKRKYKGELIEKYNMGDYLTDIILLPEAKSVGKRLADCPLVQDLEIDVLEVIRNNKRLLRSPSEIILEANDLLRVRCDIKQIQKLKDRVGVVLKSDFELHDADFETENLKLVEAIVAPNSNLIGKTIKSSRFRNVYRANALAIRQRGQLLQKDLISIVLKAGDAILLEVRKEDYSLLRTNKDFVIVSDIDIPKFRRDKILLVLLIAAGIIAFAALEILPIMVSAIIGCIFLILTKSISLEEAYRAIDWKVIFLLGGILSLGIALEKTGTALFVSDKMVGAIGYLGPVALVAAFYLLTSLLTETMSNNATAILLAPIAITVAESMGISSRPLLMAVAFAASASFMTPVGYQTNTMIYGVGQYKFSDFIKVGGPLNFIFWLLATLLIPVFFPF